MASLNVAQMDIIIIAITDMHDNHKLTITHHNHFPAFFHQAIAESGSALSGWAFDSKPELHGKVWLQSTAMSIYDIWNIWTNCWTLSNQIYLKSRRWQVWSTAQQRIWTIWSAASRFSHLHFVKLPFFFSSCILFILSTFQGEKTHQEIVLGHSQFVVSAVVLVPRMDRILK